MSDTLSLTPQMLVVLGLLAFTIYLFVSEIVRVDVAAVLVMVILGLLTLVPGLETLIDTRELFSGFGSNAVISIIAVMIIGAGLDKTGIMSRVANFILRVGGATERRIIPMLSGTVGLISSFMQNVGAAALFLPVASRISVRTSIPLSRLLMPMGYCAILGGTVTMVGSSPLILLNDLILNSNTVLEEHGHAPMETFGLFAVTPIGLALVASGILYFVLFGKYVLPAIQTRGTHAQDTADYLQRVYGLDYAIREVAIPSEHPLVGRSIAQAEREHGVRLVAQSSGRELRIAPPGDKVIEAYDRFAVLASEAEFQAFVTATGVTPTTDGTAFGDVLAPTRAGISEVVIPPNSRLIGQSLREIKMRQHYGLSVLAIFRQNTTIRTGLRDTVLQAGDTLVCHSGWENLLQLESDPDFVVVTSDYPKEELRPHKVPWALLFFGTALALVLFVDIRLSIALLVGAVGMVVSKVLSMDEAYRAVDWKTVFLLASLIPLGLAMETTGTAAWIAQETLQLLGDVPIWVLQATIAVLATIFTLVMSNVGATVLLVPLAVNIAIAAQAQGINADPAVFALTVGIATSNSFIIPTHQVNALIMGPAGYRVVDFLRAGGIMTILFLVVSLIMLNLIF